MKRIFFFLLIPLLFHGCEAKEEKLDNNPSLELISVGPQVVREFKDSLVIELSYADGDGDLGGFPADSNNLFVVDKRINIPFEFRIQELVPGGQQVPITGKINVILQNLFLTAADEEQVFFEIYAFDRAGHKSNVLTTDPVLLVR